MDMSPSSSAPPSTAALACGPHDQRTRLLLPHQSAALGSQAQTLLPTTTGSPSHCSTEKRVADMNSEKIVRDEIAELDRIADQRSYEGTTRNGCDHLPTYMPFSIRNSPILVKVAVAVAASDCSGQPYGGNSSYGIDVFF
jgi:hypothetical protein